MTTNLDELYDYDVLRTLEVSTAFVVRLEEPTLVLGGSQPDDVLADGVAERIPVRRRRGGGGVVLLTPDDLWVDFWLPRSDERVTDDLRRNALLPAEWWYHALVNYLDAPPTVHVGGVQGDANVRVACFAGAGPGELFLHGAKLTGVTQWSVREGIFLSTLLPASDPTPLVSLLKDPADGMATALGEVHYARRLGILRHAEDIIDDVVLRSGVQRRRNLMLLA